MNSNNKFGRVDKKGNKYFMLIKNELEKWQQIPISFLLNEDENNKIRGQFVSSMWYNIKIPEKDYEVVIVQVNENIVTVEMPKILSALNKSSIEERKSIKNVIIHYIFLKETFDNIKKKLENQLINDIKDASEHFKEDIYGNEIGFSFIIKKINNELINSMYSPCFTINN